MTSNAFRCKTFKGVPENWHQMIRVYSGESERVRLYFKCRHKNCNSLFKKSCNLRDHFRKHTKQRPFTCPNCDHSFTQSGNLGRHLKNVHGLTFDRALKLKLRQTNRVFKQSPVDPALKEEQTYYSLEQDDEGSLIDMNLAEFQAKFPHMMEHGELLECPPQ